MMNNGLAVSGRDMTADSLRGLAIILVVMGHVPGWLETLGINSELCTALGNWFYGFHVPLLFMLSGYAQGMKPYKRGRENLVRYFSKNIVSLYIPCLFFSYIQAILNLIVLSSTNSANAHIPGLKHFVMIPFTGFLIYWFLMALFIVKCLHVVFERVIKREGVHFLLWVLIFIIAVNFANNNEEIIFSTDLSVIVYRLSYGLYFHAGYEISRRGIVSHERTPGKLCGALLFFAGTLFFFVPYSAGVSNVFTQTGTALCMSLSLMILFYALGIRNEFLTFCGLNSMVIYCVHNYAAMIFRILYRAGGFQAYGLVFLPYAVCVAMALFIPLGVVWLYKNVKCFRWIEYVFYPGKLIFRK